MERHWSDGPRPQYVGETEEEQLEEVERLVTQSHEGRRLQLDLFNALLAQDTATARARLGELLALRPLVPNQMDPAGQAVIWMLCDELDDQSRELWSEDVGPSSLDPLVDRLLPVVQAVDGALADDLRWALQWLSEFTLSTEAKARVDAHLATMNPLAPPLTGAHDDRERKSRVLAMENALIDVVLHE